MLWSSNLSPQKDVSITIKPFNQIIMDTKTLYRSYRGTVELRFIPYAFFLGIGYDKSDKELVLTLGMLYFTIKF